MPFPGRTDRASIISASISVLNEHGLDAVSLRAIAAHLDIRQPALYHHFASKSDLLNAVAEELLNWHHADRLPVRGEAWQDFAARYARSMREAMLSVRDGARLIASTGSRAPRPATAIAQISFLQEQGFEDTEAVLALISLSRYAIGTAVEQQQARDGGDIVVSAEKEGESVHRLTDIAHKVVALGPEHEFETGLRALIQGLSPTTSEDA